MPHTDPACVVEYVIHRCHGRKPAGWYPNMPRIGPSFFSPPPSIGIHIPELTHELQFERERMGRDGLERRL